MDAQPAGLFPAPGISAPGVLDALIVEEKTGRLVLAMFERRPWNLGERQLWELQEKFNAYVSFVVDGELAETHPELVGRPVCLQLRTVEEPSDRALHLVSQIREQLRFLEIEVEVWHIGEEEASAP
jgi:hypothetical protein